MQANLDRVKIAAPRLELHELFEQTSNRLFQRFRKELRAVAGKKDLTKP